ncbi:hypothetical protein V2J09_014635 [Rumex salicifolius]
MVFSLRSTLSESRWRNCRSAAAVHDDEKPAEEKVSVTDEEETKPCTSLTVWRKSLLFTCNGFTVIDSNGSLAYRVDNYIGRPTGEVVLMDGYGKSILTVRRRKNLSLVDDWLIYEGEASDDNFESLRRRNSSSSSMDKQIKQIKRKPAYYVKKHLSILQPNSSSNDTSHVLAHVYTVGGKAGDQERRRRSRSAYVIEGSYSKRSCKVLDCSKDGNRMNVVAEIKRKEAINGCASFGLEVFHLIVRPGFDPAFSMSLVLLLDQMFT